MKSAAANSTGQLCPAGTLVKPSANATCGLSEICGHGTTGNQWWRFITAMFLHSGIVHFLSNAFFQIRVGANLERDLGTLAVGSIFVVSAIGGFIFGGSFSPTTISYPSVGSSGGLFGIFACITLDLIMNWSLLRNPKWEIFKTFANILIAFLIGWLPGVDNFAHLGGYVCGIFMGFLLMPQIYFSKEDKTRKTIAQYSAIPFLIIFYAVCLYGFYNEKLECSACQYVNCFPGLSWYDLNF